MKGPDRSFLCATGPASRQKHAARIEFRFQKQLCKSGMSSVRSTVIQAHFRVARQFDFVAATTVIDQRNRTDLGICIRRDTNGTAGFDVAIAPAKLDMVSVKVEVRWIDGRQRAERRSTKCGRR